MTWEQIFKIGENPKAHPKAELLTAMAEIKKAKFWRGPYFTILAELDARAASEWVREDVFGHTFTGSESARCRDCGRSECECHDEHYGD
jgi:hypothetical protein